MQSITQKITKGFTISLFALFVLPMVADAALSGQAGNTVIRNTVSVAYKDAGGNVQTPVTSTVDVTVTTVDATPTILAYSPTSGTTTSTGATQAFGVQIRTNSNGPGSVSLTGADGSPTNMAVSATTPAFTAGSVFLGSTTFDPTDLNLGVATTVATAGPGTITIAVPNDGGVPTDAATTGGATGDNVINGLAVNDVVYVTDGTTFYGPLDVTTVTDPAVGAGATAAPGTLVLTNNTGADITFTPAVGWMIVEAKSDTMTVTQGAITDPTAAASWVTSVTATMGGAAAATTPTVTTNASEGALSVVKYVRNVTAASVGTGGLSITINGAANTYYTGGVSGKPSDVLEYALVVTNVGAALATVVVAKDNIPAYTTLQTSASGSGYGAGDGTAAATDIFAIADDASATNVAITVQSTDDEDVTITSGDAAGATAGSALTFYAGTTNAGSTATGGSIAAAAVYTVIYRVIVD